MPVGVVAELDAQGVSDNDPAISHDGTTIELASDRSGNDFNLYVATRSCP